MKPTCQHRFIAQHLQNTFGHLRNWPFSSVAEIEKDLCRKNLSLAVNEYLVFSFDHNEFCCGKTTTFQDLTNFPAESFVIPFHKLERFFYEKHADDYVEL